MSEVITQVAGPQSPAARNQAAYRERLKQAQEIDLRLRQEVVQLLHLMHGPISDVYGIDLQRFMGDLPSQVSYLRECLTLFAEGYKLAQTEATQVAALEEHVSAKRPRKRKAKE